jgi:hypothetical protein
MSLMLLRGVDDPVQAFQQARRDKDRLDRQTSSQDRSFG